MATFARDFLQRGGLVNELNNEGDSLTSAAIWRQPLEKIGNSPNFGHIVHWECLLDRSRHCRIMMSAHDDNFNCSNLTNWGIDRSPKLNMLGKYTICLLNSNLINFSLPLQYLPLILPYVWLCLLELCADYNRWFVQINAILTKLPKSSITTSLNWRTSISKEVGILNLSFTPFSFLQNQNDFVGGELELLKPHV